MKGYLNKLTILNKKAIKYREILICRGKDGLKPSNKLNRSNRKYNSSI